MLHRLIALFVLASAPAVAGSLRTDEAALNEQLRGGVVPAAGTSESAELQAAHGALALALGRRDEATRLFESAGVGLGSDCALRARLAELGRGSACASLRPGLLDAALLGPPTVFALVAARDGETGSAFPAALLVTALKALAPAGGLTVESTADRFRVTGSAALEGLWYLDDRLLLTARPAPGRDSAEAGLALEAFLALRPSAAREPMPMPTPAVSERVERRASVEAHGLALELPAGWSAARSGAYWLAPAADPGKSTPPRAGAITVRLQGEQPELQRRRNPMARRKRTGQAQSPELAALPTGAELLGSRPWEADTRMTSIDWRAAGGGAERRALMRSVSVSGRRVLAVAHVGGSLTIDQAQRVLAGAHVAGR